MQVRYNSPMDTPSPNISILKPGRPRNHTLRLKILKIARDLAIQKSYRQVSLQKIAAVANVSRPTIYRWWPDKIALFLDIIKTEFEVRRAHIDDNASDSFRQYIATTCDIGSGSFGGLCIDILIDVSEHADQHKETYQAYIVDSRTRVQRLLVTFADQQDSQFAVPIDIVTDMVIGIMWYRLIHKNLPLNVSVAEDIYGATRQLLIVK
jgi:AcrR family transcriptional regulator